MPSGPGEQYVQRDLFLEISRGTIPQFQTVNKFGRAVSGVQTSDTDIWDRADATPTQQIWTAPTVARTHQIVSTSTNDASAGTGARTIKIFGLTDWNSKEVSETFTMNGTTNVPTANKYVIIHRMQVLTKGGTSTNVGTITATADDDGSVTAAILPSSGQTQMAIYGIPSIQKAYITDLQGSINKSSGSTATINFSLKVNPEPDAELTNFLTKYTLGVQSNGSSHFEHTFRPYNRIDGPAIIKMQGVASALDVEGSAGFDLILVDN